MENNKKDLIISSSRHLSVQVETANIQLSIASQLSLNIENKLLVALLKNIHTEEAVEFISKYSYLNDKKNLVKKTLKLGEEFGELLKKILHYVGSYGTNDRIVNKDKMIV